MAVPGRSGPFTPELCGPRARRMPLPVAFGELECLIGSLRPPVRHVPPHPGFHARTPGLFHVKPRGSSVRFHVKPRGSSVRGRRAGRCGGCVDRPCPDSGRPIRGGAAWTHRRSCGQVGGNLVGPAGPQSSRTLAEPLLGPTASRQTHPTRRRSDSIGNGGSGGGWDGCRHRAGPEHVPVGLAAGRRRPCRCPRPGSTSTARRRAGTRIGLRRNRSTGRGRFT